MRGIEGLPPRVPTSTAGNTELRGQPWEYKVIELGSGYHETQLNNYGIRGWELVAVAGRYGEFAYLKRRRGGS